MPDSELQIIISENKPADSLRWNKLAEQCGIIWQAVFYDDVQLFFNNRPVYFECFADKVLIGGVKIYFYQSKKLPAIFRSISTRATQGCEFLFDEGRSDLFEKFNSLIHSEINKWLSEKSITSFYEYSFYGERGKLISLDHGKKIWESNIGIAVIDLEKSEEELWQKINPKHRSEVIKAQKHNVALKLSDDIDSFFVLLDETYKYQNTHKPNKDFIRKEYEILKSNNSAQLVFANHEGNYLCGALLYNYGLKSLYNFGGTAKNSIGAGQFLQWEIMKYLKKNNYHKYYLGETSLEIEESNRKFSEGITKFKLRFGPDQIPTFHKGYALHPMKLKVWKLLQKIIIRK